MKKTRLKPLSHGPVLLAWAHSWRVWGVSSCLAVTLAAGLASPSLAADPTEAATDTPAAAAKKPAASSATAKNIADQVRAAVDSGAPTSKRLTLVINGKEKKFIPARQRAGYASRGAGQKSGQRARCRASAGGTTQARCGRR